MKTCTTFFALLLSITFSLSGQVVLNQDFTTPGFPPPGWTIDQHSANWSSDQTENAGGTAPEAKFSWSPEFMGTSRLISHPVDLSSNTQGVAIIGFKHMVDHYSGSFELGVAIREEGGSWTTAWSETVSSNISASEVRVEIPVDYVASSNLQIAFYFSGNSQAIDYWYIDDVKVMIPLETDLAISGVEIPAYFFDSETLSATVTNMGMNPITSFDLNWQIADGVVNTTSFTDLDIAFGESSSFDSQQLVEEEPGSHTINVFISNINGEETDDDDTNNSNSVTVNIAHQQVARLPLFEEFTSSTCGPCATFNNTFFNNFSEENKDQMVLVKYQMNWPGSGDPYYTPEGGQRRQYYGVTGVPSLIIDGKPVAASSSAVNYYFDQQLQVPSFLDIEGDFEVIDDEIIIDGELIPYANFTDVTFHVIVIENETFENGGSNSEVSFHHVMMKMLPDAQGTEANLTANEPYPFSFTHDMSSTDVEEMEDLRVVVFLQDNSSKEIYQGAYLQKIYGDVMVDFNIDHQAEGVPLDQTIIATFNQPVKTTEGEEITAENLNEILSFNLDDQEGEAVAFNASINDEKTIITVEPDNNLAPLQQYYIRLASVMGTSGDIADPVTLVFTTENSSSINPEVLSDINIYPNPARNLINAELPDFHGNAIIRLIDSRGNVIFEKNTSDKTIAVDVSAVSAGLYFLEIKTEDLHVARKVQVIK